jgi:hypothetical protein
MIEEGPSSHSSTLIALSILWSFLFRLVWFRCNIIACPYGRLQGVLLDNKSLMLPMILFVEKK